MVAIAQALQGVDIAALEARMLLAATLRVSDVHLIAHNEQVLSAAEHERFRALVARRAAGEPLAYIMGEREFFSR